MVEDINFYKKSADPLKEEIRILQVHVRELQDKMALLQSKLFDVNHKLRYLIKKAGEGEKKAEVNKNE